MEVLIAANTMHHQKAVTMACVFDGQWETRPTGMSVLEKKISCVVSGGSKRQRDVLWSAGLNVAFGVS